MSSDGNRTIETDSNDEPGALIPLNSLPNLRDIGGYEAHSGTRVRTGMLFRSVALDKLIPDDLAALERFGIRTVFDLRTAPERSAAPDLLPPGATGYVCDVLADTEHAAPTRLLDVIEDPARATEALSGSKATDMFHAAYRNIVSSESARDAYRKLFTHLADANAAPALIHCTTGKDRTGWAAAATLLLLGVDERDVFYDYELTNRYLLPFFQPLFERFADAGGEPEILKPVLGVQPSYLRTALDEMQQHFGSITDYFRDGLGIDETTQQVLRDRLTA